MGGPRLGEERAEITRLRESSRASVRVSACTSECVNATERKGGTRTHAFFPFSVGECVCVSNTRYRTKERRSE